MEQPNIQPLQLSPGEKLPATILTALKNANERLAKTRNFEAYIKAIQNILGLRTYKPLNENQKYYLGGFLEGEGSLCIGAKKNKTSAFGVYLDPAFNVTQHVNGSKHLFECLCFFRTGRIRHKAGSNATLVFEIDARQSLKEKVLPFYREYVIPSACEAKKRRFSGFSRMLDLFDQKAQMEKERFLYELAPIWDELRLQKGQKNESFRDLNEFQEYVIAYVNEKPLDRLLFFQRKKRGKSNT